jgi:hypothetical protein
MDMVKLAASWAASRLKEPSTAIGLTGIFVAWHLPGAELWVQVVIAAGSALAAGMSEKGLAAFKE